MAVQKNRGYGFWWVRNEDGGPCPTGKLELDSNVTVAAGDGLMRGSDGYGDLWTSGNPIYGFAMEAITASATAHSDVLVALATPTAIFSGRTNGAGAATIMGDTVAIAQGTGVFEIDQSVSTNALIIQELDESVSTTFGTNAQFLVKVIQSQLYRGRDV